MKVTAARLKKLISEQYQDIIEAVEEEEQTVQPTTEPEESAQPDPEASTKVSAAEYRKSSMEQARGTQTGITDQERSLLHSVVKGLRQAAADGSITSGNIARHINLLIKVLQKQLQSSKQ